MRFASPTRKFAARRFVKVLPKTQVKCKESYDFCKKSAEFGATFAGGGPFLVLPRPSFSLASVFHRALTPRVKPFIIERMTALFYSLIALAAVVVSFAAQGLVFLAAGSLVLLCQLLSALSLYSSLCLLYFSFRFLEERKRRKFNFLFAKVFWPAPLFSALLLFGAGFNFASAFSSALCLLAVLSSIAVFALAFLAEQNSFAGGIAAGGEIFPANFSEREKEVADLILRGKTAQEAADALFVSLSTVKTHIQHIYEKADVHNRAQFARWAQNHSFG